MNTRISSYTGRPVGPNPGWDLNRRNWQAQNVPLSESPPNDPLTPQGLFDVGRGLNSKLAAAAVYGNSVLRQNLEPLGSPQLGGNVPLDFTQPLVSLKRSTLSIRVPLKSDAGAQKAAARGKEELAVAVSNAVDQDLRFLINGLLLDVSTLKTSIKDLEEIETTQKQLVGALVTFSQEPTSLVDKGQVDEAISEQQATISKIHDQQRLLVLALEKIKKLTGNDEIGLHQIPMLKNSQGTDVAPIVTSSKLLMSKKETIVEDAILNNGDIQMASAALELAEAQLKAVEDSKTTVSASSGNLFIAAYDFARDPIGKIWSWIFGSTSAESKDITLPLAEAKAMISRRREELEAYKQDLRDSIRFQLSRANSPDFKNLVDSKKELVDTRYERYSDLKKIATENTSTVSVVEILRAKVTYLKARQAYNESATQFMADMNSIVKLGGGYADSNSELFVAFNRNFIRYWGSDNPMRF
jgi:hypothetical protein